MAHKAIPMIAFHKVDIIFLCHMHCTLCVHVLRRLCHFGGLVSKWAWCISEWTFKLQQFRRINSAFGNCNYYTAAIIKLMLKS